MVKKSKACIITDATGLRTPLNAIFVKLTLNENPYNCERKIDLFAVEI